MAMGNAVTRAATDVREQLLHLAAERLEARPEDMLLEDGRVFVKGAPDHGLSIGQLAVYAQTLGSGPILAVALSPRMPQSLQLRDADRRGGSRRGDRGSEDPADRRCP